MTDFKKYKKNEGIHYNTFLLNGIKISIVNIPITNLVALGIFSEETKSAIIRIYLLNMIISFLNYTGEKSDFLKSKQFNDIKSLSKINDKNFTNYLYSKIYDSILSIPIQINFNRIAKKIFKRRVLYIKDIHYKNYYLIDLSNNKTILSLETLHDKNNGKEPVLKTSNQKKLWNELIFHCHNLKNDYIKKNNMTFNGIDYQNFFVKVEYKVTYPRRNFIIKFLPLLNGMCIIHEYIQLKLSTFENEEKKAYNEKNIIYGYDAYDNIFRNSDNRYFENEHYLLKQVHFFIIESLFCSNNSSYYFFVLIREPKIYFSEEILGIIDNEVKLFLKNDNKKNNEEFNYDCTNDIINKIINVLYEDYIQINNNEKIVHKTSKEIIKNKKNDLILKEIQALDSKNESLKITKNETLLYLFNSIQFNKNINPNDITLDLNDERISQLRLTQNDNNEFPSPRRSDLIGKKKRPNSIRLSELLSEKHSIKPSRDTMKSHISRDNKFPYDSEEKDYDNRNKIDTEQPLNEDEYYGGNLYEENNQRYSYQIPQDNFINTSISNNNGIIDNNYIENNMGNYNNDYSNYNVKIKKNEIINDNYNNEENNYDNEVENNNINNNLYREVFYNKNEKGNRDNIYDEENKKNNGKNNEDEFNNDNENEEYIDNNYSVKNYSSKKKLRKYYNKNEFSDNNDINDANEF